MNKKTIIVTLLLVALVCIIVIATNQTTVQQLDMETLKQISQDLILLSYRNDYEERVMALSDLVTNSSKINLLATTQDKYSQRALYGEIRSIEIKLYEQTCYQENDTYVVVSIFKELLFFNTRMYNISIFTEKDGAISEIKTTDYTDSVEFQFD